MTSLEEQEQKGVNVVPVLVQTTGTYHTPAPLLSLKPVTVQRALGSSR